MVSLAGACGGDDEVTADAGNIDAATPDAAPPTPTLDDICDETDGLYIDYFGTVFTCQADLFELLIGAPLPDDAELSDLCYGALGPYIDDGTVELGDAAALQACADWLAGLDCDDVSFDAPSPCDDVFVGTIDLGGDCDSGDQCAGDAYCDSGAGACGTCTALEADGASCDPDDEGSECLNGHCIEDAGGVGVHECGGFGDVGDDCMTSQDCLGTRVCDPSTDLCAAEPTWAVDTPCTSFPFDCGGVAADLYCHPGTGLCVSWLDVDDPCDQTMGVFAGCRLFQYESCQNPGGGFVCVIPTIVNEDDACGFFTGEKCVTGLICDDGDGVCKAPVPLDGDCSAVGAVCEFFVECVDGICQYGEHTGMCPAT